MGTLTVYLPGTYEKRLRDICAAFSASNRTECVKEMITLIHDVITSRQFAVLCDLLGVDNPSRCLREIVNVAYDAAREVVHDAFPATPASGS